MAWQDNMTPLQVGDVMHGNGPQRGRRRCRIAEKLERRKEPMADELAHEARDWANGNVASDRLRSMLHRAADGFDAKDARITELKEELRDHDAAWGEETRVLERMEKERVKNDEENGKLNDDNDALRGEVAVMREGLEKARDTMLAIESGLRHNREQYQAQRVANQAWTSTRNALASDAGKPEADVITAAQKQAADHNYGNLVGNELGKKVCAYEQACRVTNAAVERMNEKR